MTKPSQKRSGKIHSEKTKKDYKDCHGLTFNSLMSGVHVYRDCPVWFCFLLLYRWLQNC